MNCQTWVDPVEAHLDNGLRILIDEMPGTPVVSVGVFYRVGSIHEPTGMTGVSHWIEHLLFKGTPHLPEHEGIRQIRQRGGLLNAHTTSDYTVYYETLPKEHLGWVLELEADRMRHSCTDPQAFERERSIILSELEGLENATHYPLRRALQATAYQIHPYRNPVIGWRQDIERLSYSQLVAYYQERYVPGNALLVVVGGVAAGEVLELASKAFGKLPSLPTPPPETPVEPVQSGERRVEIQREVQATYLSLAYHIPAFAHPDAIPLRVLEAVLGFGRGGRLHQGLVEKRLATAASIGLFLPREPGLMVLGATVPENLSADKAEAALREQIQRIQQEGIQPSELERAIRQREMSFLYARDSITYRMRQLGTYAMLASPQHLTNYLAALSRVTCEDVQRVAQRYLVPHNGTVAWQVPRQGIRHVQIPSTDAEVQPKPVSSLSPVAKISRKGRPTRVSHRLSNGLRVIVQRSAISPIAEVRVRIRIGGTPEPEGLAGLSSFTAHLLQWGTHSRSASQIASAIESVGAHLHIQGSVDGVSASLSALVRDIPQTLSVLADVLCHPAFPRCEIEKQREQIRARLQEERGWPVSQAYRAFYSMVYPESHPYRYAMGLDLTSIEAIRRRHLCEFHRRYFRPDRASLVLVADMDPQQALELVESNFGRWHSAEEKLPDSVPSVDLPQEIECVRIPIADRPQAEVLLGHVGIARDNPDYHRVMLMNQLLNGLGGRLYQKIREELGLAYGICSSFSPSLGAGPFIVHLGTRPQHVDRAVEQVIREIRHLQTQRVTTHELEIARRSLVGRFVLSMQTHAGIASALSNAAFYNLPLDYLDRYAAIYEDITPEEIQRVAQRYLFPDRYSLAIAGPAHSGIL